MLKRALLIAGFLSLTAGTSVSADATGMWRTEKSDAGAYMIVRIYKCGSSYCGKAARVGGGGSQSVVGTTIIKGMKKSGKKYSGGTIYAPDNQKTYKAKMEEKGANRLRVSGCVGPFCRHQTWRRQ